MPRLPFLNTREALTGEFAETYDAIMERRGAVTAPVSLLLHAPGLAYATASLGAYFRQDATLSKAVQELAIITTARQFNCEFVWAAHVPAALREGITREAVDAVGTFGATTGLPEEHAAVIALGRELIGDHQVSPETYDALVRHFGERGVMELQGLMGFYLLIACTLLTAGVETPEGRPRLPHAPTAASG